MRPAPRPTRRTARDLLALAACGTLLAACGAPAPEDRSGDWRFGDSGDGDVAVELPERPTRVVAYSGVAAALWDYGFEVVGVFGPVKGTGDDRAPQIGDVDTEKVEVLSETYGELGIERLAEVEPDLIVTHAYDDLLWYLPEDKTAQIEAVAPIAAIQVTGVESEKSLKKTADLAVALGVDAESPKIVAARDSFEDALAGLDDAVDANPDLRVTAVSANEADFFVGNAAASAELGLFTRHGVRFPETDAPVKDSFEQLSWEEADKYPTDLLLQDSRPGKVTPAELADIGTWRKLPAVEADQVGAWEVETPYSYDRYAGVVTRLAGEINDADRL
ncbi:iron complex transport system substrate-binding protein [Murinocardiopsis flavida]|uniref:Iron complex transport system substrate-binding protein n=1 Tax=Murinocardiopsis flavida TaxID=645275 RepID=A0A2P8DUL3_9ACTN|nr:ABC transporter substrate-binding protein [Murinocardiopsis flavida]PSL00910.1 iron complex transport system substrate-binding protein [Murinocardiopsis flavida]